MPELIVVIAVVVMFVVWLAAVTNAVTVLTGWIGDAITSPISALTLVSFFVGLFLALHSHFEGSSRGWTILWSAVAGAGALGELLRSEFPRRSRTRRRDTGADGK